MLKHTRFLSIFILLGILFTVMPAGQSGLTTFFGPETFIRGKGKPVKEVREFSTIGFKSPYILHVQNGDENGKNRVSSANVWINGDLLFGPSDFSQKISGYDLEIELDEQNLLEVQISSKPESKLKIWIEGAYLGLDVILDYANSISSLIDPEEGGKIETTDSNGTHYSLEIPHDAFWDEDAETITMTPILDCTGLPLNGAYVAGVRLEPHGLRLFLPVTLTIKLSNIPSPDDIFGICYNGEDGEYYITPIFSVNAAESILTFEFMHFSDWIGYVSTYCPDVYSEPLYPADIYKHALGCAIHAGELWRAKSILSDWFNVPVYLELWSAYDLASLELAISGFLEWLRVAEQLGLRDYFKIQEEEAIAQILGVLENELSELDTACSMAADFCQKTELYKKFQKWLRIAVQLGYNDVEAYLPNPTEFCNGLFHTYVKSVEVIPESDTVILGGRLKLASNLIALDGQPALNRDVEWSSSDESVARIDKVYIDEMGINVAVIKAIGLGYVTITAKAAEGCNVKDSKTIRVEPGEHVLTWTLTWSDSPWEGYFTGSCTFSITDSGANIGSFNVIYSYGVWRTSYQTYFCGDWTASSTHVNDEWYELTDPNMVKSLLTLSIEQNEDGSYYIPDPFKYFLGVTLPAKYVHHQAGYGENCAGPIEYESLEVIEGKTLPSFLTPGDIPADNPEGTSFSKSTEVNGYIWEVNIKQIDVP